LRLGSDPGFVVGLAAEARLVRSLGWPVAIGGGTAGGARLAAERLVSGGITALISFGLAGGLDPALRAGRVLVPRAIITDEHRLPTDPALSERLGCVSIALLLGARDVVAGAAAKAALFAATGAAAVDLESGAVARVATEHGLPFAALRAICDPAERDLPPAALIALDRRGGIGLARVLWSVLVHPAQVPALLELAGDAAAARRALRDAVTRIRANM
jgi:adenosylhomocysteine nucleosidase